MKGGMGTGTELTIILGSQEPRTNLADHSATLPGMMTWLAANPQPAYVPAGTYVTSAMLNIPLGADLEFRDVTIDTQNEDSSSLRIRGDGNIIRFTGTCRIGLVGQRYSRQSAGDQAGLNLEGPTNTTIHADDLTIEGVANIGILMWDAGDTITLTGKFTMDHTGADSLHVSGGTSNVDVIAEIISQYSGDDGAAVVSGDGGSPCTNIRFRDVTVLDQIYGRGIAVVGGTDVTFDLVDIDGSYAAPIYMACEPGFSTLGVDGVTVVSATIANACTGSVHNTNVQFYSDRVGKAVENVTVTMTPDSGFSNFSKTGAYAVTNCYVNTVLVTQMALGTYTKILKDDFNRGNETPATGWTDSESAGMRVVSNALVKDTGGGGAYWAADSALTDFEAYWLVGTAPDGSDYLKWRFDGTNGYQLQFSNGDVVELPGSGLLFTTTCTGASLSTGEEVGIQMIGSAIEVFVDGVSQGSGSDATVASGRCEVVSYGTAAWDSFSLGVPGADTPTFLPRMMVVNQVGGPVGVTVYGQAVTRAARCRRHDWAKLGKTITTWSSGLPVAPTVVPANELTVVVCDSLSFAVVSCDSPSLALVSCDSLSLGIEYGEALYYAYPGSASYPGPTFYPGEYVVVADDLSLGSPADGSLVLTAV